MTTPVVSDSGAQDTSRILTIPNVISIVRLACLPLFLWLLFGRDNRAAAAALLAILGTTDWIDGYIARHFNQVSDLGKILDPVADRLLFFVGVGGILVDGSVPAWFAWAVLIREVLVAAATIVLALAGARRIDVTWFGKAGTFGLMVAFPLFLASHSTRQLAFPRRRPRLGVWHPRPDLQLHRRCAVRAHRAAGAARGSDGTSLSCGRARCRRRHAGRFQVVKAVIMAGGEGTRLRPLTSNCPKPMLPLANRPMMEHIVDLLKKHGFDDIVVTVAFLANQIRTYFGDGSEFGVRMCTPRGPAARHGGVGAQRDGRAGRAVPGDFRRRPDRHRPRAARCVPRRARGAAPRSASWRVDNPLEFGIVITHEDGSIERFLEKPTWGQVFSDTINTGIFVLEPKIFDYIAADRPVDFSSEVFPRLLEEGQPLFGAVAEGYWEDVGTLEAYLAAHKDMLDGKVAVNLSGFELNPGVWLGEGAEIHPEAKIEGFAVIGDYCRVDAGVRIGDYTVLGSNVRVRSDADLDEPWSTTTRTSLRRPPARLGDRSRERPATRCSLR